MRRGIVALATAAFLAVPTLPAQASPRDCTILGPDYVAEVVDCALFIIERAINW
ncbi:MAG TPA: hypothetical protein VHI71_07105 [Actinomycetota bacterium]|nr:hypothetical protein [Actinomycetota bacterium]